MKPVKVTHSKKTDFFSTVLYSLRLVVKYRFISEFPLNESIFVDVLRLVTVSSDFAKCNFQKSSRLSY